MTIPITRSAPGVRLTDAALADLALHLGGVRLPWGVLGGSVASQAELGPVRPGLVGVVIGDDIGLPHLGHARVLLLDRENTPVASLVGTDMIRAGPVGTVAHGEIEALTSTAPLADGLGLELEMEMAGGRVVVAMRPWLTSDSAGLGLDPAGLGLDSQAAGETPRRVVVLVPSESASPDGVPARTLRRCIDRAVAEIPGVEVRTAPLVWRDPDSDRALALAVAERALELAVAERALELAVAERAQALAVAEPAQPLAVAERAQALAVAEQAPSSGTVVLDPQDPGWRAILHALAAGDLVSTTALADGAAAALLQWRPPPEQRGLVVMFTGLSGSGKSTLAAGLVAWLETNTDRTVTLLDGDIVRQQLSSELGFDLISRDLNIRRIGYVAGEIARHHGIAVCAPIAPFDTSRKAVRTMVEPLGDFVLVHMATPLAECERRDRKGLYAKARAGLVTEFTGISSPYEVPVDADLSLDTSVPTVSESLAQVVDLLRAGRWLPPGRS